MSLKIDGKEYEEIPVQKIIVNGKVISGNVVKSQVNGKSEMNINIVTNKK